MSAADLYDVCGEVNEYVRNALSVSDFAVVWLGDAPDSEATHAIEFTAHDASAARVVIFVSVESGMACSVVWVGGCIASTASDEALRAANALMVSRGMQQRRFQTLTTAYSSAKEWSATRQAGVLCTAARAACASVDVLAALEDLPPSDAFVVQHDGVAKCSDAAIADVLASRDDPGRGSEADTPMQPVVMFNSNVRLFF